ncbi:MAG: hypothetical protein EAX95_12875 [Candidatus Thorarchaeota archaeon]|nr:hypothetical protein [Candidatus Thorarchaeota archaeon]
MKNTFNLRLEVIQPSQLYISSAKLNAVLKKMRSGELSRIDPIPIKVIDDEMVSTDGHTRGVAWFICGHEEVEAEWEDTEMDWEAYRICVQWCKDEGIHSIVDLKDRIIDHYEYEKLWLEKCRLMQEDLRLQREEREE